MNYSITKQVYDVCAEFDLHADDPARLETILGYVAVVDEAICQAAIDRPTRETRHRLVTVFVLACFDADLHEDHSRSWLTQKDTVPSGPTSTERDDPR